MKDGREEDLPDNIIKLQQAVLIASIRRIRAHQIVAALEADG